MNNRAFIIAEIGVNHNGDIDTAKKLIKALSKMDIDAVKTQAFSADSLASTVSELANYQSKNTSNFNSQYEMLKKYELSKEDLLHLSEYSKELDIKFFTSVFSIDDFDKLKSLDNEYIKIPSGEFTNFELINTATEDYDNVILSTGLSDMKEVEAVIEWIRKKQESLDNIFILHCTSSYPCPIDEVDIKSMMTIGKNFNVKIGFSDHTENEIASLLAVALGAKIIEKHVTLDKNMEGPDHKASQDINEFGLFVEKIREAEKMIGKGDKQIQKSALENLNVVKKSIYASKNISKGEYFSKDNTKPLRPAGGIDPVNIDQLINKKSRNNYVKGDQISTQELS